MRGLRPPEAVGPWRKRRIRSNGIEGTCRSRERCAASIGNECQRMGSTEAEGSTLHDSCVDGCNGFNQTRTRCVNRTGVGLAACLRPVLNIERIIVRRSMSLCLHQQDGFVYTFLPACCLGTGTQVAVSLRPEV